MNCGHIKRQGKDTVRFAQLSIIKPVSGAMNDGHLEMTSHYEKVPIHFLISIFQQCPQIYLMIHETREY